MIRKLILVLSFFGLSNIMLAKENIKTNDSDGGSGDGKKITAPSNGEKVMGGCAAGKTQTVMELNNVRMTIMTSGDMWWDLTSAKYEVPKNSKSYACFAGSLWFGGYVGGSSLKVAAMTYRQSGVDFWPGPLTTDGTAYVDATTCSKYDKHFKFNRKDVDALHADWATNQVLDNAVPNWIKDYPGNAPYVDASQAFYYLAPFHDEDGDMSYDPNFGDYPLYNVTGVNVAQGQCKARLFGDETLFWVFNDKGNIHTETDAQQIGVEIRAQAFQFATSDELNDMSFYNFEIINRGTYQLDSTYFAVWVDADLGNYADDYIGCDVGRGLGYIYNGDNYDEDADGNIGYHDKLPALGCDFFQGPNADIHDLVDNDRDGCVDCTNQYDANGNFTGTIADSVQPEQIVMARFNYYNNTGNSQNGNPAGTGNGSQFYNLMRGRWKDGSVMTYGGNGLTPANPACKFMYPGNTDPNNLGTTPDPTPSNPTPAAIAPPFGNWTEINTDGANSKNQPGDRRFLQSAGKFTLAPGSVNYITFGMPFVRTASANNFGAIPLLQAADDKAQALFDACFKVLDGPDAPDLTIQELENQFIFYLSNKAGVSNNYEHQRYNEIDPSISPIIGLPTLDRNYKFEGYQVFQIKDYTVSATDLDDENKARLIFQCDIQNGVKKIVNYKSDPILGSVPQLMVDGEDKGIKNSFIIGEDKFAAGSNKLVNHKTYYYMAVAYGYNSYLPYAQDVPPTYDSTGSIVGHATSGDFMGQKKPYLRGRRNIKIYSAIPHNTSPETYGTNMNSVYGFGPKITRMEGQGNGGNILDLTDATVANILNHPSSREVELEYQNNRGPIGVKVIDPLKVLAGNFTLKFQKIERFLGVDTSVAMGTRSQLDSGKVRRDFGWVLDGTYTDESGQSYTKQWTADEWIGVGQEQILTGVNGEVLGISINIKQVMDPQPATYKKEGHVFSGDLLESSISFSDGSNGWLTGIEDSEGENNPENWIRSGAETFPNPNYDDIIETPSGGGPGIIADPGQLWETVVGGTWAPYRMAAAAAPNSATIESAPALGFKSTSTTSKPFHKLYNSSLDMRDLASVDVVITSDKSKWSRCPVIELCHYSTQADSNQFKFLRRRAASVDKNGNAAAAGSGASTLDTDPNYISDHGMGWFPGYAINVETGERLNIAFGENSSDVANNGNDMIWNPTSVKYDAALDKYVFGGMHYIYVFGHNGDGVSPTGMPTDVPRYDAGSALFKMLDVKGTGLANEGFYSSAVNPKSFVEAYKDVMWVNLPLLSSGNSTHGVNLDIPSDCKVRIRVAKPYRYGLSGMWSAAYGNLAYAGAVKDWTVTFLNDSTGNPAYVTTDTIGNPTTGFTTPGFTAAQNANFPMYRFSTGDLVPTKNVNETAKDALSQINIVPNPYYGHSQYERTRIDNVIKVVNLPPQCTIRIYSLNGTLMRTLKKDTDNTTDIIWDLKNQKNIPVASGLYIFHIEAPGIGEKILKWFGVMRPIDLQSY
ncbi:MAG: hypothetical protein ACJ76F_01035 [Bacteroidia bacterium]